MVGQVLNESHLSYEVLIDILNGMDSLIYVTEMGTDKILFINEKLAGQYGVSSASVLGKVCWQILPGGRQGRCSYCPVNKLNEDPGAVISWVLSSSISGRHYRKVDRVINWEGGKKAHLQHAMDISDLLEAEAKLERRLKQQELMFNVSQSFIAQENLPAVVDAALQMVGEFMLVDKIVIANVSRETGLLARRFGWFSEQRGIIRLGDPGNFPFEPGNVFYDNFITKGLPYVVCNDISTMPEFSHMSRFDIKSFITLPIFSFGRFWGIISVDDCSGSRIWENEEIHMVQMVGSVVSELIMRYETERELLKAKEQAERGSRAKSEFLSRMSHEMRTPMNAIIGMTNIAKNSPDPKQKEYCLDRVKDASSHLLGVINDVLDLAKIEANKIEIIYDVFSLNTMLADITNVINYRLEEKQQVFSLNVGEDIPEHIISDAQRLRQVLMNLLGNAVKFTPEGGRIELTVRKISEEESLDQCTLRFAVHDTGIGLSPQQAQKLFRPFEQADGGVSRKYGGTGLGLVISKSIVEILGGQIWLESQEGEGSTFFFTMPVKRGEGLADFMERGVEEEFVPGMFKGRRVLLAEDIEINREIVMSLLEPTGVLIDCAENGREAYQKFAADPAAYDMIFMDIQMPEVDGYESTRLIRALDNEKAKRVPIIAMTANVFREDVLLCLKAGMNDHVGKPLDMKEVLGKLQQYLSSAR